MRTPVLKTLAIGQELLCPLHEAGLGGLESSLCFFHWKTEPLFFLKTSLQANCPPSTASPLTVRRQGLREMRSFATSGLGLDPCLLPPCQLCLHQELPLSAIQQEAVLIGSEVCLVISLPERCLAHIRCSSNIHSENLGECLSW